MEKEIPSLHVFATEYDIEANYLTQPNISQPLHSNTVSLNDEVTDCAVYGAGHQKHNRNMFYVLPGSKV